MSLVYWRGSDHFVAVEVPPFPPCRRALLWGMNVWGYGESHGIPCCQGSHKRATRAFRETQGAVPPTPPLESSVLRPAYLSLYSSVLWQLLLHSILLFRTCTLGSDSQSGLRHCWGVQGVGVFHWGMWGLAGPVGSSYSRQPPSRPDPRTMGIKLLLFFPANRRDDKDGIPLGLLTLGCTAEVTVGGWLGIAWGGLTEN